MSIQSKSDRDRIRQRSAQRKAKSGISENRRCRMVTAAFDRIMAASVQGRPAAACWDDMLRAAKGHG